MTEKTLTTENIKPALDALRGELAPWPVVAKKQDRLNTAQLNAANSGITSSLVAQIIANTAAIRALESAVTGTGLRALVVSSLPAVGTQGILYIVPVTTYDPETDADVVNYSNEYIWIVAPDAPVTEGYYEQVGQTGIVINNGQLNITVNGTSVGTFTANQSGDTTAAITVPTNADYVDKTTAQSIAGVKTFSDGIVGSVTGDLTGTASKAIADEDGTSIKTGYVNVAGNQTVTGNKDWTGINSFVGLTIKDSVALANGDYGQALTYRDNQGNRHAYIQPYKNTSGVVNLAIGVDNSGAVQLNSSLIPYATNVISLGSSSYQWSSVYAKTYYYNGTEFSSKFVTIDTTQTISGLKYFSSSVLHKTPQTIDVSTNLAEDITGKGLEFVDNARYWGDIAPQWITDGTFRIRIAMTNYDTSGTGTGWFCPMVLDLAKDGSKIDIWSTHPNSNLGTSTSKWKTLNGVNPGALSLPSDGSNGVEIDRTNWVYDGLTLNKYTPTVDGWLQIRCADEAGNFIFVGSDGKTISTSGTGLLTSVVFGLNVLFPARANKECEIRLKCPGAKTAYFYPCLGNV